MKLKDLNLGDVIVIAAPGMHGNWFEFGKLGITLPKNDEDAKAQSHELSEGGMDTYVETVVTKYKKEPNVFKDAAKELALNKKKAETYLKETLSDEKMVALFLGELDEIQAWLDTGYKKSVNWNHEKKEWTYGY